MMKSMNSGTPASVALPERSSFGMTMSTSMRTVAYSCGREELRLERRLRRLRRGGRGLGVLMRLLRLGLGPRERRGGRRRRRDLQDRRHWESSSAPAQLPVPAIQLPASELPVQHRRASDAPPLTGAGNWKLEALLHRPDLPLLGDVLAGPHRQREDRPGAVLVGLRHQRPGVGDEHVLGVVRLAVLVQRPRSTDRSPCG